jgi:hypothetical protein
MLPQTRDSVIDTVDHRLGDPTTETIMTQNADRPSFQVEADDESTKINRDLAEPDMPVLRVDQPARGKSLIPATVIAPKMSRLPTTFEKGVDVTAMNRLAPNALAIWIDAVPMPPAAMHHRTSPRRSATRHP